MSALVGVVGGVAARVDAGGGVRPDGLGWRLDWWIGADDRWRAPAREAAVRQSQPGGVPVVETAMRVPSGDACQRVYGAAPGLVVVEIENASPAPFVAAFVVSGAHEVALDATTVSVDGAPALVTARAPSRWFAATGAPTFPDVEAGRASADPFPGTRDRRGRLEVAWLHPVAHRTTLRAALLLPGAQWDGNLGGLPSVDAVGRGWSAQLDRGMRVDLPDEQLADAIRLAGAELVLAAPGRATRAGYTAPGPETVAALEDWGFDAEAASAWERLPGRGRRRAGRRTPAPAMWADVDRARDRHDGPGMLLALRSLLVHERDDGVVTICAELPDAWRGRELDVHDAPTCRGSVSYAVRWHGRRPALLWDVPAGVELRAPGLDPEWSTAEARGEALLAPGPVPA